MFRYAHETQNKINAYVLLTHNRSSLVELPLKLLKLDGVSSLQSLIGIHDIMLNVKMNSIKSFHLLMNKLRGFNEIQDIKILFIDKINKITV